MPRSVSRDNFSRCLVYRLPLVLTNYYCNWIRWQDEVHVPLFRTNPKISYRVTPFMESHQFVIQEQFWDTYLGIIFYRRLNTKNCLQVMLGLQHSDILLGKMEPTQAPQSSHDMAPMFTTQDHSSGVVTAKRKDDQQDNNTPTTTFIVGGKLLPSVIN